MGYAPHKTDLNHKEIRDGLRDLGFVVHDTARAGDGFPDLVAVDPDTGKVWLLEVKSDDFRTHGGKFGNEIKFMMRMVQPSYRIALSLEQAANIVRGVE